MSEKFPIGVSAYKRAFYPMYLQVQKAEYSMIQI